MKISIFLIMVLLLLITSLVIASFVVTYKTEKNKEEEGRVGLWMMIMVVFTFLFATTPIAALAHSIMNRNRKGILIFTVGILVSILIMLIGPIVIFTEVIYVIIDMLM